MPYKRPLHSFKKYTSPFYSPSPSYSMNSTGVPIHKDKDFFGIPLPNEMEALPDYAAEKRKGFSPLSGIIHYIQRNVKIEEIILLGLIVLMLDESIEDDLLLIILIYILLF